MLLQALLDEHAVCCMRCQALYACTVLPSAGGARQRALRAHPLLGAGAELAAPALLRGVRHGPGVRLTWCGTGHATWCLVLAQVAWGRGQGKNEAVAVLCDLPVCGRVSICARYREAGKTPCSNLTRNTTRCFPTNCFGGCSCGAGAPQCLRRRLRATAAA